MLQVRAGAALVPGTAPTCVTSSRPSTPHPSATSNAGASAEHKEEEEEDEGPAQCQHPWEEESKPHVALAWRTEETLYRERRLSLPRMGETGPGPQLVWLAPLHQRSAQRLRGRAQHQQGLLARLLQGTAAPTESRCPAPNGAGHRKPPRGCRC